MKKCHYCAEEIQDAAIKCKHCGEFLYKPPPSKERKELNWKQKTVLFAGLYLPLILLLIKQFIKCFPGYLYVSFIAIILYFVAGGPFVDHLMKRLWDYVLKGKTDKWGNKMKRNPNKLTWSLGHIDRLIYAFCFALNLYIALGAWFGIKIASRLLNPRDATIDFEEEGERKNTYLIGNIASLVLGLLGGIIIKVLLLGSEVDTLLK